MKKLIPLLSLITLFTSPLIEIEKAQAILFKNQKDNNPAFVVQKHGAKMVTNWRELSKIPQKYLSKVPWPDSYWPHNKFGIAWRYNEEDMGKGQLAVTRKNTDRKGPSLVTVTAGFTRDELKNFTPEQLKCLSPAEKLDVANCDYNYSLYKMEKSNHTGLEAKWEGYCHGWGPSALEYEEPGQCVFVNKDGIEIPFTSSDIKGLLIYNYATNNKKTPTSRCGVRTGTRMGEFVSSFKKKVMDMRPEEDNDVNPGALFIALVNLIGLQDKGFVFDRDPGKEVWNQPVYGYEIVSQTELPTSSLSKQAINDGVKKEMSVSMNVLFINEIPRPKNEPQLNGPLHKINDNDQDENSVGGFIIRKNYTFILELDAIDNIIGGRYTGKSMQDHIDFFWIQNSPKFLNKFQVLEKIHQDSLKNK